MVGTQRFCLAFNKYTLLIGVPCHSSPINCSLRYQGGPLLASTASFQGAWEIATEGEKLSKSEPLLVTCTYTWMLPIVEFHARRKTNSLSIQDNRFPWARQRKDIHPLPATAWESRFLAGWEYSLSSNSL